MLMPKVSIVVCMLVTTATFSLTSATDGNPNFPDLMETFSNKDMDCATTYVTSCFVESPELRCCQLIKNILTTDFACLCSLYENSHLTNGEGVSVLSLCQVNSNILLPCNGSSAGLPSQKNDQGNYTLSLNPQDMISRNQKIK